MFSERCGPLMFAERRGEWDGAVELAMRREWFLTPFPSRHMVEGPRKGPRPFLFCHLFLSPYEGLELFTLLYSIPLTLEYALRLCN